MMKLSIVLFCLIALCASVSEVNCKYYIKEYDSILINAFRSSSSPSPSPNVDCSTVIFDMIDCLSFVSNGSNVTKPEGECCSGLKTVLKTDAECLCEVFKNSADLGIVLDVKKALSLPSACGVSDSSTPDCGLNGAPGSAPAPDSPIPVPPIPVTPAPAPEGLSPAPAPSHSSASTILISFVSMLVSLVVASFSYF